MATESIPNFLVEQRDRAAEELQPLILDFETYWERKLWHQLTDSLVQFFSNPKSAPQRLAFYKVFVLKFADKINQLKLVDLALKAATQCKGTSRCSLSMEKPTNLRSRLQPLTDDQERLSFLSSVMKKVDNNYSQDAFVFASVAVSRVKLSLNDLEEARRDLDTAEKIIDSFDSVETVVHAAFYDANASYYQACMSLFCASFTHCNNSDHSEKWILQTITEPHFFILPVLT